MTLNAEQIVERKLLKLENTKGKPAQIGYDLSLKSVSKVFGGMGMVLADKTILNTYTKVELKQVDGKMGYVLHPGVYDFTMNEGLNPLPSDLYCDITQRSSLARNGTFVKSSWFDPGFGTENIGTIVHVCEPIFIEENARVAQIVFYKTESVSSENLYNGQYMNDKQRK